MLNDTLSGKQLASRHGITSDRITQWFLLLNLPQDFLLEIMEMGDHWDRQLVTERQLRGRLGG